MLKYGDKVKVLAEKSYCWTGITHVVRVLNNGTLIEVKNIVNEIAKNDPFATFKVPVEYIIPVLSMYYLEDLQTIKKNKREIFGDLQNFDYALPQDILDQMVKSSGMPYDLVLSTSVWSYNDSNFGYPLSCIHEVQAQWDLFMDK